MLVGTGQNHEPPYLLRMTHGYLEGHTSSHAITQYVCTICFEVPEQSRYIVCHTFIAKFTRYIPGTAMPLQFSYNYLPVLSHYRNDMRPVQGNTHIRSMQQYN